MLSRIYVVGARGSIKVFKTRCIFFFIFILTENKLKINKSMHDQMIAYFKGRMLLLVFVHHIHLLRLI